MRYVLYDDDVAQFFVRRPCVFTLLVVCGWWLIKDETDGWLQLLTALLGFWFAVVSLRGQVVQRKDNDAKEAKEKGVSRGA